MATTIDPKRLARVRTLALALPGATEKEAWGDPTWRIRDKIFVMQKGNYEGGRPSLWLKVEDGGQSVLVASDPTLFFVPPYVGHKGWIGIYMDVPSLPWDIVGGLIRDSHRLIGPPAKPKARASRKARAPNSKASSGARRRG